MGSFTTDGKAILAVFIGAIIALTFMSPIADSIFGSTNTLTVTNLTVTAPAATSPNSTLDLRGREVIGSVIAVNNSGTVIIGTNFSFADGFASNGLRTVRITTTSAEFAGQGLNLTYTYKPDGYQNDSAARASTLLILIMAALGLVVFVIVVFVKQGSLGDMLKMR